MNILFVVPYAPTPVRARPYNLIRSLAERGHALTVATLWENERERRALDELAGAGVRVLAARLGRARRLVNLLLALPSGNPLQFAYCWQPGLARVVKSHLQGGAPCDMLHVEHLRGARYALHLRGAAAARRPPVPVVWDSVDSISLLFEQAARHSRTGFGRWVTDFELERTRRCEAWLAGRFDRVLVTSQADRAALERLAQGGPAPAAPIHVLPNGVDLGYFTPNFGERSSETVVLTGKMSYHANATAALHLVEDVMPGVWAQRPQARVDIVGQAPAREVRALAQRHAPRVTVTGTVADLRPYLWSAAVAVAPVVYGAGIQNKVLEAMACAAPVAATPQAVAALEIVAGRDALVADGAEALAAEIVRLLADPELRRAVGRAGHAYVTRQHNWQMITQDLEKIYRGNAGA